MLKGSGRKLALLVLTLWTQTSLAGVIHKQAGVIYKRTQKGDGVVFKKSHFFSNRVSSERSWRHQLGIDLLFLSDHSMYKAFLELTNGDEYSAQSYINIYMDTIFQQLRRMFADLRSLSEKKIDLSLVGTFIATRREDCPLRAEEESSDEKHLNSTMQTEDIREDEGNSTRMSLEIGASQALARFSKWLRRHDVLLPKNDHAVLLTKYDLLTVNGETSTQGIAYVRMMCRPGDSSSVVEDVGGMSTAVITAHELLHNCVPREVVAQFGCILRDFLSCAPLKLLTQFGCISRQRRRFGGVLTLTQLPDVPLCCRRNQGFKLLPSLCVHNSPSSQLHKKRMEAIDRDLREFWIRGSVQRIFRDRANPFDVFSDAEFRRKYRFSRKAFFELLETFKYQLRKPTNIGKALLPVQRLGIALEVLASNSFQGTTAEVSGCSRSTVCRIVHEVSSMIVRNVDDFVYWPSDSDRLRIHAEFRAISGIPGVIGCGWYARQDYCTNFQREHVTHAKLTSKDYKGIGDSAYRADAFLIKPILTPRNEEERAYTAAVLKVRVKIENAIGCLKRQLHILQAECRYKPRRAATIAAACVCLRNAAIDINDDQNLDNHEVDTSNTPGGSALQSMIIGQYFS